MNNRKKKSFDIRQSAINNLSAGESISFGDVIQNTQNIRPQGASYNHSRTITERYKEKKENLTAKYKFERQKNRESLCNELKEFAEDLERKVARARKGLDLEQAKQDAKKLNNVISRLAQLLSDSDESKVIQILENELLQSLSYEIEEDARNIAVKYEEEQEKLEASFKQKLEDCKTERDLALYRDELIKKLDEDGYPLRRVSQVGLERLASEFSLDEKMIERVTMETIEPLYEDNFEEYKQVHQEKLDQEGFPLSIESSTELDSLLESLGLLEYYFEHLDLKKCEKSLVEPFYIANFEKYERAYQQTLDQEGFPINHNSIAELKHLATSLGLSRFYFEGLDVKSVRKKIDRAILPEEPTEV